MSSDIITTKTYINTALLIVKHTNVVNMSLVWFDHVQLRVIWMSIDILHRTNYIHEQGSQQWGVAMRRKKKEKDLPSSGEGEESVSKGKKEKEPCHLAFVVGVWCYIVIYCLGCCPLSSPFTTLPMVPIHNVACWPFHSHCCCHPPHLHCGLLPPAFTLLPIILPPCLCCCKLAPLPITFKQVCMHAAHVKWNSHASC